MTGGRAKNEDFCYVSLADSLYPLEGKQLRDRWLRLVPT